MAANLTVGVVRDLLPEPTRILRALARDGSACVELPANAVGRWLSNPDRRDALVVSDRLHDAKEMSHMAERHGVRCIYVVDGAPGSYRSALRAGAAGALLNGASDDDIAAVVRLAVQDRCLLPREVARRIASRTRDTNCPCYGIRDNHLQLIVRLVSGLTTLEAARETGRSERDAYRVLAEVRHLLHVDGLAGIAAHLARCGRL